MFDYVPGRPIFNAAMIIYDVNITINVLVSILTLVLIWTMYRNGALRLNLFLKCVILMTVYQTIYDASLSINIPCGPSTVHYTCTAFYVGGFTMGGIGAAIWALMSSALTLFMVEFGRRPTEFETRVTFLLIHVFILGWAVPFSVGMYSSRNDSGYYGHFWQSYNICRMVLIGVITVVMLRLYYRMRQVTAGKDKTRSPLYHLTRRLILYPVIQVVSRLGATPYGILYDKSIDSYPESAGALQRTFLFCWVIFTPIAGLAGFFVFIYMQKGATEYLRKLLCCNFNYKSELANRNLDDSFVNKMESRHTSSRRLPDVPSDRTIDDNWSGSPEDGDESSRQSHGTNGRADYVYEEEGDSHTSPTVNRPSVSPGISTATAVTSGSGSRDRHNNESIWHRFSEMDEGDLMQEYIRSFDSAKTVSNSGSAVDEIGNAGAGKFGRPSRGELSLTTIKSVGTVSDNPLHP